MKTNVYTIFDTKAKIYNKPFHQHNDDIALRSCTDLLNDIQTDIHKHPEDFVLLKLGQYDDGTATFDLLEIPETMFRFMEIATHQTESEFTPYKLTEGGAKANV